MWDMHLLNLSSLFTAIKKGSSLSDEYQKIKEN